MNRHRSWLAPLVAVLWLAAMGVLVVLVVKFTSWEQEATVADMAAFVLAAAIAAAPVVRWGWNAVVPRATRPEQVESAKGTLAALVWEQWRDESVIRSLADPIPVVWRLVEDRELSDHRHLGGERFLDGDGDDVSRLAGDFMKLGRRRLVVTGDAGTGKTTLVIRLLLELAGPGRDPAGPVPVLLPLSGWDTAGDGDLHAWLARSLERDYPALRSPDFGDEVAMALVKGNHVLPILDGMDELPAPSRAGIVKALAGSLDDADAFVLTTRTGELRQAIEDAGRPLPSAAVIAPEPLTRATAETYLRARLPPEPGPVWEGLLSGLRTGTPEALSQMAGTPLGLWLLHAVYIEPGADPAPLAGTLGRDPEELRAHLWDGLIRVLLAARPPGGRPDRRSGRRELLPRRAWDPVRTRGYLRRLARVLSAHDTRDLAWWRLGGQVLSDEERKRAAMSIWMAVGWGFGLGAGIVGQISIMVTLPVAFGAGFGVWTAIRKGFTDTPGRVSIQLRGRLLDLARQLTPVLLAKVMLGVVGVAGASLVAEAEPWVAVQVALWAALTLTPGFVLIEWMQQPTPVTAPVTPYQAWRASRTLAILCAVVPGLTAGLVAGLVIGLESGPWSGIRAGVLSGVFAGLTFGLTMVHHSAWPAYETTARHLAARGECPRNLMRFLDDAHRVGLLRVVGPVYQFRHADLQDHLAGRSKG
ncbi:NACHT domain-containing protein [Sphaerisporangium sp. B11E5]|uniref:NACHT domain-containing protein n=1 Tax=Sphaerisporangium sp. B11E5 TaxID=3153563 RepID=UPI00325E877A